MPSQVQWIESHLQYLQGLKKPSQQQQLFMELATKDERTATEEKRFKVSLKLEKLAAQTLKAKSEAASIENAARREARKARDHELYNTAGLLIMAGLVDTKTGQPVMDKAELLGALMGLANVGSEDPRRQEWKRAGDDKLSQAVSKKAKNPAPEIA